ncbi:unnamed protein product [Hermetia illucens]|uniref:Peptidoglycan binding-like domain-containing protein n=1 Tax=Hermetia illucens TaxID=343691 RepID=A0A7R8UXP0_HERIL|nr:unnamed protein product [Hermetia illucens]
MEFGYLPKSDIETGNLRTEEQFREAIRKLQEFGNVPVTGQIDEQTVKLMRRPRCGIPDRNNSLDFTSDNRSHRYRFKRYVIQGAKWEHTDLTWR